MDAQSLFESCAGNRMAHIDGVLNNGEDNTKKDKSNVNNNHRKVLNFIYNFKFTKIY